MAYMKTYIYLNQKGSIIILRFTIFLMLLFFSIYAMRDEGIININYIAILLVLYLMTNIGLIFVPYKTVLQSFFINIIFIFDVLSASACIYFTCGFDSDMYLIYFLILFMSGIGQNVKNALVVGLTGSLIYGGFLIRFYPSINILNSVVLIRIPFFFATAIFVSFFVQEIKRNKEMLEETKKSDKDELEKSFKELRTAYIQLQSTQTQLIQSEKMAGIGQLASGVAHELNNPMGVILGFAQSVVKRIKEDDPLYMPLKSIEREAIRCKKLVGDLLIFSRTGDTYSEITDINKTIDEALSPIETRTKLKNIELIKEYGNNLPQIIINKNQIQQVIVNLCNNAIDACQDMPEGGKITIRTKSPLHPPLIKGEREGFIEISVTDTGTGIPEEIKQRMFEPFFTTKEVGKGTGLGLSLCYEIIRKYNGIIEVESPPEPGAKGTTFIVKLPVK